MKNTPLSRTRANTGSSASQFMKNGVSKLRRTASFSNIQIQEATNEEEDDDEDTNGKDSKVLSPEK